MVFYPARWAGLWYFGSFDKLRTGFTGRKLRSRGQLRYIAAAGFSFSFEENFYFSGKP
jgi:hypothetical protein